MTTLLAQCVLPGFEHLVPHTGDTRVSLWDEPTMAFYKDEWSIDWCVGVGGWTFLAGSFGYCVKTLEEMEQATRRYLARNKS